MNEWAREPGNRDLEIDGGPSSTLEAGVSALTVGGSDDPFGWLGVSNGEASEYRESVKTSADIQCTNKDLGSWDLLGYRSPTECTTIVNYGFAMTEQFHLRRCDHHRSLGTGCQDF